MLLGDGRHSRGMARFRTALLYLAVVAIWGTTWIAIKSTVATVPPITASGLRFAIAFPVLALIVARRPGIAAPLSAAAGPGCSRSSPPPTSSSRSRS